MRPLAVIVIVALVAAAGLLVHSRAGAARATEPNPYEGVRAHALRVTPGDLGLKLRPGDPSVYGVVMDWSLPEGTATVVAYSTGDASVYLDSGGGVIGGFAHSKVREAARRWMQVAETRLTSFSRTTTFERPGAGQVRFFVLTTHGAMTATVTEAELSAGGHVLSPVWNAGQQVMAELRLAGKSAD